MKLSVFGAFACLIALAACASTPDTPRALHERLLVLDTHLDTPANLPRAGWDIAARHDAARDFSQVDLPRMIEGGLDGGFWVIYTPQGPRDAQASAAALAEALERARAIRAMIAHYPAQFALATNSADAAHIHQSGKRIVYMSIENAYPLSGAPDQLPVFYDLGARMLGLVHFTNNDFADSATDPNGPEWHGLSPAGRELVRQANRLGMILDASHASDQVFDQLLDLSATPIILSHSGPRAVFDHPRNLDDTRLKRLAEAGGVIQINALGAYLTELPPTPERRAALADLRSRYGAIDDVPPARMEAYLAERRAIDARFPAQQADFEDFMRHLLHALEVVGPEHVGVGADWDGGGGVAGMEDVREIPKITERLIAAGYSEREIANIWGGNVLRLLRAAEAYAAAHG